MILLALLLSYLIGSLPTAYIAGRVLKGIDIRQHGSGNVGATNTFRVLGKKAGLVVLGIDILKGIIPVTFIADRVDPANLGLRIILGLIAILGHNWTIFLNFKGGKGMATSLGLLIGLCLVRPSLGPVLGLCLLAWTLVFLSSGYVSLASIVAAVAFPLGTGLSGQPVELTSLSALICLLVVIRHRSNIRRLLQGQENRVSLPYFPQKRS